nr:MAG TPA: hypothetical protein [Caudoviricetes sp.]DAT07319.1 MAG TPA: hypothetical protein [Caudoviricetes sp.]
MITTSKKQFKGYLHLSRTFNSDYFTVLNCVCFCFITLGFKSIYVNCNF